MVTLLDVSAVVGHHAMPAALLFLRGKTPSYSQINTVCKPVGLNLQECL